MSISGRDFLTLKDFSQQEVSDLVDLGIKLKSQLKNNVAHPLLNGKTLAMIFQKSSTRTRMAFEVGMYQLGGQAIFLNTNDLQIGRGEPIKDTARVLSRYVDGILIRTYEHAIVEEFAKFADVPIINGLTNEYHPTQVIADLITIKEHKGMLKDLTLAYVGDGNNMAHSLMIGCSLMGMNVRIATPSAYMPDKDITAQAMKIASLNGGSIVIGHNPDESLANADIVYTDTWASMGQESEKLEREKAFKGYQIDQTKMTLAKSDAILLHCLPAYRGYEVTDEVIESAQSVVFDEAENRLHAHKAIMASVLS